MATAPGTFHASGSGTAAKGSAVPPRSRRQLLALLLLGLLAPASHAAKTLIVQNPWRQDPARATTTPQIFGAYTNWVSSASAAAQFTKVSGDWWSFQFTTTNAPGDFRLLNLTNWQEYGNTGIGSVGINLDALFATVDTVWLIPTPAPSGPPALLTRAPTSVVLMLQNPWETAQPGIAPSLQVESQSWRPFAAVPNQTGWYCATADLFSSLEVGIRNGAGTSYLGATGVAATATTMVLDSMLAKNDTIWIVPATNRTLVLPHPPSNRSGTLMLLNPWEADQPGMEPSVQLESKPWTSMESAAGQAGWYSIRLDSFTTMEIGIRDASGSSYLTGSGISGTLSTMLLDTALARNDTIWIVPTVASPKIVSTAPSATRTTILLWNPWESSAPGRSPSLRVEQKPWSDFAAAAGMPGWYSADAQFHGNLAIGIRDADSSSYLTSGGISATPATLVLDTAAARNDTVWIVPFAGQTRILSIAPKARTLMVSNPWDGIFPLERPVIFADGSSNGIAATASSRCGWYAVSYPVAPNTIFLKSSGTGSLYGSLGRGSTSGISVSGYASDTIWIDAQGTYPYVTQRAPVVSGTCPNRVLATTIHDFHVAHPGFERPVGGVVPGMLQAALDAERKPVRGIDTAWNEQFHSWFRDSSSANAATCRDLVLALDTATGSYRRVDTAWFPIDDFATLSGGGSNPFNERLATPPSARDRAFCAESHGDLVFQPGQVLTFGGSDDRWFFLDGRLIVDLGAVHPDTTFSVLLDTLGLIAGKTYKWDLFACQRGTAGSALTVSGPATMSSGARFAVLDSIPSPGVRVASVHSIAHEGEGCSATRTFQPSLGEALIQGPSSPWTALDTGTQYGGIAVSDSSWRVVLDTSRMKGLQPGSYVLRLRSLRDTTVFRDIPFTVPNPPFHVKPGSRCDLMTSQLPADGGCLDVGQLDGTTLRVPLATTRLSSDGLVLCGKTTSSTPGTDIVYVVDQSGSMGWNDSTGSRAQVVKDAIELQSVLSPSGYATWIPFENSFSAPAMIPVSDATRKAALLSQINAVDGGGTYYAGPLGWARALLQGATQASNPTSPMPPSPSRRKAIIMISDGEPSDAFATIMASLAPSATVYSPSSYSWKLPSDSSPPVYGFFISSSTPGSSNTLKRISDTTHGGFFSIPVGTTDSLKNAMTKVLGSIISKTVPDTLYVLNRANGQRSVGLSSSQEGSGWRFHLDSLVALEPGRNDLELRTIMETANGDSAVVATWTVIVSDSGMDLTRKGSDTTLDAACFEPTTLKLHPATDTARRYADERDTALAWELDVRYDRQLSFPTAFTTLRSLDSGSRTLSLPAAPLGVRAVSKGSSPWTMPPVSTADTLIQTRHGWDTVRVVYRTSRDRRDTAEAFLPVYHPWPVSVTLSPDTSGGYVGSYRISVDDSNILVDTVRALVRHRLGDTVSVLLRRGGDGRFGANVPYAQNQRPVPGDTILQTGPVRRIELDSIEAIYTTHRSVARDTAILKRPPPTLRFIDASGAPVDSLPLRRLDLGELDTVLVGLFVDSVLIRSSDSVAISRETWLRSVGAIGDIDGFRLSAGTATVAIQGVRPGTSGRTGFRRVGDTASLDRFVDVLGYRIRFVDAAGNLVDSASIDRDQRSDTLIRFELWGQRNRCDGCSAWAFDSVSSPAISVSDSAYGPRVDSIRIQGGRGSFHVQGGAALQDGRIVLDVPSLWARATLRPVVFQPLRIRFLDASGAVVDSASVDRDLFSDTLVRVQVWGRDGICTRCDGMFAASASTKDILLTDSANKAVDSFELRAGRGSLRINGNAPFTDSTVALDAPLFAAQAGIRVTYRPYRLRFLDASGAVVDSANIDRDLFSDTLVRIQVWGRDGICTRCDGMFAASASTKSILLTDSANKAVDSFKLRAGRGSLKIGSKAPVSGGRVELDCPLFHAASNIAKVDFHALRLRFVAAGSPVSDSLASDTLVRRRVAVELEVWGLKGPIPTRGILKFRPSSKSIRASDSADRVDSSFQVRNGRAKLWLRSDIPLDSAIASFGIDSLWAATQAHPLTWRAPAPDSASYFDRDGDGGLDRIAAWFPVPWNPANALRFPWPDSANSIDLSKAKRSVSSDSLVVTWTFARSPAPKTTAWKTSPRKALFSWDSTRATAGFVVRERIAPVPLRARLQRGDGKDTLVVRISETLDESWRNDPSDLVRRIWPASNPIPAASVSWNPGSGELRLVLEAGDLDKFLHPGDSVRLRPRGSIRDADGTAPSDTAVAVEVEGRELAPTKAVVADTDADGRADQVRLVFTHAPRTVDTYAFRWPGRDGKLQVRELAASKAASDSNGRILTFKVQPWEFGATSCPDSAGCADLGRLRTTRWGDTLDTRFPLEDGVVPVILKAQLRFGFPYGVLDTVRAIMSESVKSQDGKEWMRWGRPRRDSLGDSISRVRTRRVDSRTLEFIVDSSFHGTEKDSLRIGAWPGGGIQDPAGNRPGRFAHWTRLEPGPVPLRMEARLWPSIARNTGWDPPRGESPISVFVRRAPGEPWKGLDGRRDPGPVSHYAGISLQTNKEIDGGTLFLYDNLGVAVAELDLSALAQAVRQGRVARTLRGGYETWIAWNGTTSTGKFAPSGVYIGRLVVWKRVDGQQSLVHQVFKLGWQMPTVHNWDENDMPNW